METLLLIFQVIIGLLLLTFLVVIHELGHAVVARRNGVVVEEFGIGFPPRAWGKKLKNKVLLSINWLPLGGFVKLKGESDDSKKKGDYGAVSLWSKTKILLAGVAVNWVFAILAFTVLALVGFPKILPNQFHIASDTVTNHEPLKVAYLESNSPASRSGIKQNDILISLAGKKLEQPEQLVTATKEHRGETVSIVYEREGIQHKKEVSLRQEIKKNQGVLGVSGTAQTTLRSTWSAPIVGVGATVQFSVVTVKGLGDLVSNLIKGLSAQFSGDTTVRKQGEQELSTAGNSVAGPIGILGVIFPAAQSAGPVMLLLLMGIISLTLAVMNILPIPALDGGRLFVTLLFRVLKKPLSKEREEAINGAGFSALMLLIVVITIADVSKLL